MIWVGGGEKKEFRVCVIVSVGKIVLWVWDIGGATSGGVLRGVGVGCWERFYFFRTVLLFFVFFSFLISFF